MASYPIEIVSYDPCWVEEYQAERGRIAGVLGARVLRFEHMGSTSVPGLDSKPIIDISAAVSSLATVPGLFGELAGLGYHPIDQRSPDRYDLWRVCEKGRPSHILHFMQEDSDAWCHPIIFRNALRADAELRAQYSELKRQLAEAHPSDIEKYGNGKTEFIRGVLDEMTRSASSRR